MLHRAQRQVRARDRGRQQHVVLLEERAELAAGAMEGLHGADVLVGADRAADARHAGASPARDRPDPARGRRRGSGCWSRCWRTSPCRSAAPGCRGVVVGRTPPRRDGRALPAAWPCARRRRPAPDRAALADRLAHEAPRAACPAGAAVAAEEGPGGRRAIGIARLAAGDGVEQRGAVAHGDRHAMLRAGAGQGLADRRQAHPPARRFQAEQAAQRRPGCGSSRRRRWHAPSAGRAPPRRPPSRPTIRRARDPCARDCMVAPPKAGSVVGARPNSLVLVRPTITRPARRMRGDGGAVGCGDRLLGEEPRAQRRRRAGAIGHQLLDDEGHALERPSPAAATDFSSSAPS